MKTKLHLHRWLVYNNGWRRRCKKCLKIQVWVGNGWQDTLNANLEGKDTEIDLRYFR